MIVNRMLYITLEPNVDGTIINKYIRKNNIVKVKLGSSINVESSTYYIARIIASQKLIKLGKKDRP